MYGVAAIQMNARCSKSTLSSAVRRLPIVVRSGLEFEWIAVREMPPGPFAFQCQIRILCPSLPVQIFVTSLNPGLLGECMLNR